MWTEIHLWEWCELRFICGRDVNWDSSVGVMWTEIHLWEWCELRFICGSDVNWDSSVGVMWTEIHLWERCELGFICGSDVNWDSSVGVMWTEIHLWEWCELRFICGRDVNWDSFVGEMWIGIHRSRNKTSDLDLHLTTNGGKGVRVSRQKVARSRWPQNGRGESWRTLTIIIYSKLPSHNRIVQYVYEEKATFKFCGNFFIIFLNKYTHNAIFVYWIGLLHHEWIVKMHGSS